MPLLVYFFYLLLQFLTTNIAVTLILEHACLLHASWSNPTAALEQAYSQYISSNFHNKAKKQFAAPPKHYSNFEFMEFILKHRLS
jgi:hypothetical protein